MAPPAKRAHNTIRSGAFDARGGIRGRGRAKAALGAATCALYRPPEVGLFYTHPKWKAPFKNTVGHPSDSAIWRWPERWALIPSPCTIGVQKVAQRTPSKQQ